MGSGRPGEELGLRESPITPFYMDAAHKQPMGKAWKSAAFRIPLPNS